MHPKARLSLQTIDSNPPVCGPGRLLARAWQRFLRKTEMSVEAAANSVWINPTSPALSTGDRQLVPNGLKSGSVSHAHGSSPF